MSVAQEKLSAPSGPISAKNPQSFRPCVVVPVFNHSVALDETFRRLAGLNLPCFFINDGSTDGSGHKMSLLCAANDNFQLHSHLINQGKGAAVLTGFREAVLQGYSHAIQIDCDGQHTIEDIPRLIEVGRENPDAVVLAAPVFDRSAPKARLWGREVSNVLAKLETLRLSSNNSPRDVLCGFRLYPINRFQNVLQSCAKTPRMDFDISVIVKLCWANARILNVKSRVTYPEDGISHFNYLRDNILLTKLHTRLVLGMFLRSPLLLWRNFVAR